MSLLCHYILYYMYLEGNSCNRQNYAYPATLIFCCNTILMYTVYHKFVVPSVCVVMWGLSDQWRREVRVQLTGSPEWEIWKRKRRKQKRRWMIYMYMYATFACTCVNVHVFTFVCTSSICLWRLDNAILVDLVIYSTLYHHNTNYGFVYMYAVAIITWFYVGQAAWRNGWRVWCWWSDQREHQGRKEQGSLNW